MDLELLDTKGSFIAGELADAISLSNNGFTFHENGEVQDYVFDKGQDLQDFLISYNIVLQYPNNRRCKFEYQREDNVFTIILRHGSFIRVYSTDAQVRECEYVAELIDRSIYEISSFGVIERTR